MFEATEEFGFFEYFRVPYRASEHRPDDSALAVGRLWKVGQPDVVLRWPLADRTPPGVEPATYVLNGKPIFGHVVPDALIREQLAGWGQDWQAIANVVDGAGHRVASVWRDRAGSVVLPFDPGDVMLRFWSEGYQNTGSASVRQKTQSSLLRLYYAMRPLIPRPVQIAMRRVFTRVQEKATFPAWPIESALHDFYEWFFGVLAEFADGPVPWLDVWPEGKRWALVLTHDVETEVGLRNRHLLRDLEREYGRVSSWNFVPLRYDVTDAQIQAVQDDGCEVGVHGLKHDGRDIGSLRLLKRRLPAMREYARRWNGVGFRSPATHRVWEWMPLLSADDGFEYDSSYHDTAPHEPRPGGACSYFPYLIRSAGGGRDLVELPITLPQDHTLFTILRHEDGDVWIQKAAHVRERGGMVLVLTHPDYAAADPRVVEGYRALLETYADDPTVWHVLPREVAAWWRRRAASSIRPDEKGTDERGPDELGTGWSVTGPAALDARIRFARTGIPTFAADRLPTTS